MDVPTPVVVGVPRRDGYTQVVEQRTVFLVRTGASDYHGAGKQNRLGENLTSIDAFAELESQRVP